MIVLSVVLIHSCRSTLATLFLALLLTCSGCDVPLWLNDERVVEYETIVERDTLWLPEPKLKWQQPFGLTHDPDKDTIWGKPVSYYFEDSTCAGIPSDFYYGYFRPGDDGATKDLLALATTDNARLRPFYRWCLARTIEISDGALGEYVGLPARRYAEKFPREFIEYLDSDSSESEEQRWADAIAYSGFYSEVDYRVPEQLRRNMMAVMRKNCRGCTPITMTRLQRFADLCYEKVRAAAP